MHTRKTLGQDVACADGSTSAREKHRPSALATRFNRRLGAGALLLAVAAAASADDLLHVFQSALANDPVFLADVEDNQAARQSRQQALAGLSPTADLSVEAAWNESDRRDYRSHEVNFDVVYPLYHPDRSIAIEQADSRIAMADALITVARQDLIVRVAELYFGVLEARDEIEFARATSEAFEQQLKESRQRFEIGLTSVMDVEEAKAGYDLANARLIAAQNTLDIAYEALRETTGNHPAALVPLAEIQLVLPEPTDVDKWAEIAEEQNLRVLVARYDSDSARREVERIEAELSPSIDAIASVGVNDRVSRAGATRHAKIGLRLSMPLFDGGSISSRSRESLHRYRRTLEVLERERRRAQREAREAYLGINSSISRVTALKQAVRSSEAAATAVDTGYRIGARTSVDVLNAQRDLLRTRRDLSEARYDYILNMLKLKRAAGALSDDDVQLVTTWLA